MHSLCLHGILEKRVEQKSLVGLSWPYTCCRSVLRHLPWESLALETSLYSASASRLPLLFSSPTQRFLTFVLISIAVTLEGCPVKGARLDFISLVTDASNRNYFFTEWRRWRKDLSKTLCEMAGLFWPFHLTKDKAGSHSSLSMCLAIAIPPP